jgi:hypothetical protein
MQKYALLATILLPCTLLACADDGEPTAEATTQGETGDGDGDGDGVGYGDGDGDGNGDGDGGAQVCWDAPQTCLDFIQCAEAVVPQQIDAIEAQFGVGGSCWCDNTEEAAQACYETCREQLASAVEDNPTEPLCHGQYCPIEELDPTQPYGPVTDGTCPNFGNNSPQRPVENPFGLPGSFCAPKCSGIAKYCVDHPQTIAEGTCFLTIDDTDYCVARCWVDPYHLGKTGTQCQCGARCQPYGAPDGDGNLRGICTYE